MIASPSPFLNDDALFTALYWLVFSALGMIFHYTLKTYLGSYASSVPIILGSAIHVWKNEYLIPGKTIEKKKTEEGKTVLERLKKSVQETREMKHIGAGSNGGGGVFEYDASGNKMAKVSSGLKKMGQNRKKKTSDDDDEEQKDHTTIELKGGRLVNSKTSHLTSAMDWHEGEIVPPRRRTHQKRIYTGKRKKKKEV